MNQAVNRILGSEIEDVTSQPSYTSPDMLVANTGYTNRQANQSNQWNSASNYLQNAGKALNITPASFQQAGPTMGSGYQFSSGQPSSMFEFADLGSIAKKSFQPQGGMKNWMFGEYNPDTGTNTPAYGMQTLGAALGVGQALLGFKQYKMGKKAFKRSIFESDRNYNAQKQTINTAMEDRARANYSANPNFYQSPEQYMNENRIK